MSVTLQPAARRPFTSASRKPRGAEPAIASDVNIGAAAVSPKVSAQAAAELLDIRTKEFGIRDAANIVLAENGRLEHIF